MTPEGYSIIAQMLVLISTFSGVFFNIITITICRFKRDQIEIILTGLILTITSFHESTVLSSVSTDDDQDVLAIFSGLTITLNFKSSIHVDL